MSETESSLLKIQKSIRSSESDEEEVAQRVRPPRDAASDSESDPEPEPQVEEMDDDPSNMSKRQLLESKLELALKRPKTRRSKADEDDLEQMQDEMVLRLKDEMQVAARKDASVLENPEEGQIALSKIKLLPRVMQVLNKALLADTILDNNLLQSVRIWLEPLPDGSLPSYEIQKNLFQAIERLPIKTEHLKESGLGRVMIFYQKSKRVEPQLKRTAEKLVAQWTRPIIGASDNYRDRKVLTAVYDMQEARKASVKRPKKNEVGEKSAYEEAAARRGRAAAPPPTAKDFKFAPVSKLENAGIRTGVGSSLNNNELFKRINSRLTGTKRRG